MTISREAFYFERHDENDSQPTGWYVRPGLNCIDGDGPFTTKERADSFAVNAENYLREVFGCTLRDLKLPEWKETLACVRENAEDGYVLDCAIIEVVQP